MTEIEKLLIARIQVENLQELLKGNEYFPYMNLSLTKVYYELERQINNHGKRNQVSGV